MSKKDLEFNSDGNISIYDFYCLWFNIQNAIFQTSQRRNTNTTQEYNERQKKIEINSTIC